MLIEEVKKLEPFERFCYWMKERHRIFLLRKVGRPKPWTDDEVLQSNFFTNPFRENDKVTVWFRENIRGPLKDDPRVLMATIIFRWFNLPETGEVLVRKGKDCSEYDDYGWLEDWKKGRVVKELLKIRNRKEKVFTGAFMVPSPYGETKVEGICGYIDTVWRDRKRLLEEIEETDRLEHVHEILKTYKGLGGFMSYEIVCDLRYTYLLKNAVDKETWANPGPGAIRGMFRLQDVPFEKGKNSAGMRVSETWDEDMIELLKETRRKLGRKFPKIEMREIEHSLCEFDKYERVLWGDGRSKRKYNAR